MCRWLRELWWRLTGGEARYVLAAAQAAVYGWTPVGDGFGPSIHWPPPVMPKNAQSVEEWARANRQGGMSCDEFARTTRRELTSTRFHASTKKLVEQVQRDPQLSKRALDHKEHSERDATLAKRYADEVDAIASALLTELGAHAPVLLAPRHRSMQIIRRHIERLVERTR